VPERDRVCTPGALNPASAPLSPLCRIPALLGPEKQRFSSADLDSGGALRARDISPACFKAVASAPVIFVPELVIFLAFLKIQVPEACGDTDR